MPPARSMLIPLVAALSLLGSGTAAAQGDLNGRWRGIFHEDNEHRIPGPMLGDYTGIPLNEAARLKARTWDASILSQPEQQARPHPAVYSMRGPANLLFDEVVDPDTNRVIAIRISGLFGNADRTIWMDGRPHPTSPRALHTWAGFSTGEWIGPVLKVTTTHLKAGFIQRNGVPTSARATMTEFIVRHGNYMTNTTIVEDPVYLDEPFIRTTNFVYDPTLTVNPPSVMEIVDEVAAPRAGYVPNFPIGTIDTELAEKSGLPVEATQGGRETIYPEYARKLAEMMRGGRR
jgi:hypothetical protein